MKCGSLGLGIRSGSYGALQQQGKENNGSGCGGFGIQTAVSRKPSKMFKDKDKDNLFHRICKVVGRKKVGMLLLCIVSAAVFGWVLYVGKGEDSPESNSIHIRYSNSSSFPQYLPKYVDQNKDEVNKHLLESKSKVEQTIAMPPPPPLYFLGYTLPPGHPCNSFTLPPPPADKKRTGPRPCPVCYLPVNEAIALIPKVPSYSPVLQNLTYIFEENLTKSEDSLGGSDFGGYPSLKQRNDSYDIKKSMRVNCGFVRGPRPGHNTGFDLDDSDLLEMEHCGSVVVASAIFGNFDVIQQPKNISEYSKQNVCFFMFVDEETEANLKNSSYLDADRKVGLWRIVVIHNPPYADARRTGKVPKLLMHRLFPNARFSIWLDGKLELVVDPFQILERFLWRKNATFAISRHYRRFDVFVEADANKAAAKYDNASIDFQIEFYRREGLTPYSEAKLPITSDVPEGCVILREHVPMSNLFTCLWFNEVDRFTSRDQISFSTVRDKIMSRVNWTLNMFWDCERRNFVIQKYHKDLLDHLKPPPLPHPVYPPPPALSNEALKAQREKISITLDGKGSGRCGKDKKGGSQSHRKINLEIGIPVPVKILFT